MSHQHHWNHHQHDHHHHSDGENRAIGTAFFLNAAFTVIEIIGGFYTNSMAILSDAIHDLGDTLAIGIAWALEKLSLRKGNTEFSYGYRRMSTLAALINVVILTAGSVFIAAETIPRLLHPEEVNSGGMIVFALLGVFFNGLAVWRLGRGGNALNQRTVRLHLLEDVLGWGAVLVGSIVIHFTGFYQLDPILSLLIAAYILFNALRNMRGIMRVFLQATPGQIDVGELKDAIKSVSGVAEIHDFHLWTLDGDYHVLTLHAVTDKKRTTEECIAIKESIRALSASRKVGHVTIELESAEEHCQIICN
jgi:cobalt-zinc-cadmium efflux system protein